MCGRYRYILVNEDGYTEPWITVPTKEKRIINKSFV